MNSNSEERILPYGILNPLYDSILIGENRIIKK